MKLAQVSVAALLAACGAACTPAFDWREFMAEGSGVVTTFPCRPDRHTRAVVVADSKARMEMLTCATGGQTFALSFVDVADPARVTDTLLELRAATVANVQGVQSRVVPALVAGMTPNAQAVRLATLGRLPDGVAVHAHAIFFTKGLRVYQATVIGVQPAPEVIETFFSGLKFPS